jgi:hypothetical protein
MTVGLPPLDPNDTGTDLAMLEDIGLRWPLVNGQANIAMAVVRRLSTSRGSLYYALSYGFSLLDNLEGSLSTSDQSSLKGSIKAEVEKDPRIDSAQVQVQIDAANGILIVTIVLTTAAGPFQLVLQVSALSVTILNAGQAGAPTGIVTPVALTPSFVGPPGAAGQPGPPGIGQPGPPGPGGNSTQSFSAGNESEEQDDTGAEVVFWQFTLNANNHPTGTLNLDFSLQGKSPGGTAVWRLYVGGSFVARFSAASGAGGSIIGSPQNNGTTGYAAVHLAGTIVNPTGFVPITVTLQSPGASIAAYGQRCEGMVNP